MTIPTFPSLPGLAWPVTRIGPIFDTIVQDAFSGQQTAYAKRVTPKWSWELPFEMLRSGAAYGEFQTLVGFHAAVRGRARVFQYRDAVDHTASGAQFGLGDGVETVFQLTRMMGGFVEPVFAPVGTLAIDVGGTPTTAFTLGAFGMITFTSAPPAAAPVSWSGDFNWLCRFDDDKIEFSNFMDGFWSAGRVAFTSVIP